MTYKGERVLARGYAKIGDSNEVGKCLREIRLLFGIDPKYASATSAWRNARHRFPGGRRGYPCFWQGGSQGYGHIALDVGGGYCISTDRPNGGHWGKVSKSSISAAWNMTYAGFTTDLNGASVYARPIDASRVARASYGHPTYAPHSTYATELLLHARGYLALSHVNGRWDSYTTAAWKRWQKARGVKQTGHPGLRGLRRLALGSPYALVRA